MGARILKYREDYIFVPLTGQTHTKAWNIWEKKQTQGPPRGLDVLLAEKGTALSGKARLGYALETLCQVTHHRFSFKP